MLLALIVAIALVLIIVVLVRRERTSQRQSEIHAIIGTDAEVARELEEAVLEVRAQERPCWKPVCEEGESDAVLSKFGGRAARLGDETWPECGNCREPMQLFLQLSSGELPIPSPFGSGVLQFFYCTNGECETACEAWAPRAASTLLRVIPHDHSLAMHPRLPESAHFPVRTIKSWTRMADYPHFEDYEALGIDAETYLLDEIADQRPTQSGDKLLGWPAWVQSAEYPQCRECQSTMNVIFQVDSEDNIPFMFGDVGTGHISSCPNHPAQLAFGWACS